jgi:hypothetical protein
MSNFVSTTPFRINGFNKLMGGGITLYGKDYTIQNLTIAQSASEGLTGYWVHIAGNDKNFHLNVNFPKGKVELWEFGSALEEVSTNLHKRDFKDISTFLHLTKYLLIEYDRKHPNNPF